MPIDIYGAIKFDTDGKFATSLDKLSEKGLSLSDTVDGTIVLSKLDPDSVGSKITDASRINDVAHSFPAAVQAKIDSGKAFITSESLVVKTHAGNDGKINVYHVFEQDQGKTYHMGTGTNEVITSPDGEFVASRKISALRGEPTTIISQDKDGHFTRSEVTFSENDRGIEANFRISDKDERLMAERSVRLGDLTKKEMPTKGEPSKIKEKESGIKLDDLRSFQGAHDPKMKEALERGHSGKIQYAGVAVTPGNAAGRTVGPDLT